MKELIERLEKLTGPDREVDAHIALVAGLPMLFCDFGKGSYHGECDSPGCGKPLGLSDERNSYPRNWEDDERLPLYTASVDAVIALIKLKLPGWCIISNSLDGQGVVLIHRDGAPYGDQPRADSGSQARPIAIAHCLALLRALPASGDDNGVEER